MRQFKLLGAALGAALLVAACGGGGGNGDQSPALKYSAVVSFGDSLSDAGTYQVGPILASGGGQFTINGIAGAVGADPTPSYNWAQLVSAAAVGKVGCAARKGGFGVPEVAVAGCTNYAQGGARVTGAAGVGNAGGYTAALTEPVAKQIANYTADGGKYSGDVLFTVLAGANDLFAQTSILSAAATAAGNTAFVQSLVGQLAAGATNPQTAAAAILAAIGALPAGSSSTTLVGAAVGAAATQPGNSAVASPTVYGPMVASAQAAGTTAGNTYAATTGATNAAKGMATAATELAAAVKTMLANGAQHVLVVNVPDVSQTPMSMATIVRNADGSIKDNSQQKLVLALTNAFNQTLLAALQTAGGSSIPGVVFVDAFAENQRQLANPAHYALTDVAKMACNLNYPANVLATNGVANSGSSLVCNTTNVNTGDVSHYLFADGVHPTPYGHKLLAQYVTKALVTAGWL